MTRFAVCVSSLLAVAVGRGAEAGSPRLARILPPGGQRGTTVEVQFTGRYLDKPEEVMLYGPGITVESIEFLEGEVEVNGRKERVEPGTRVRVRLKLADDCPLGAHGMRLRTAHGVSDYQRFFVGPFPTIDEDEQPQKRNNQRDAAKAVEVNTTVLGRMNDPVDIDLYRVEVSRGQRVSAEIEAARLGIERGVPDLHLSILDADGKQLAAVDDSALFVQDPIVSLVADRDGPYFIAVRHSIYNAANEIYRLHVGTFSRPTAVFPTGGQVGQELSVRVLGDPRGEWTQTVKLPSDQPGEFPFIALDGGVSAPTPNKLRVSSFANVLEAEPNDMPDAVASGAIAELPVALNGIIEKPGDVDYFRFQAKKDDRFKVHALANAFGSPLDPTITIRQVGGKPGAAPLRATDSRPNQLGLPPAGGLNRDTLDPVIEFTVPADGEYVLSVEDDRGRGGADFVYRVEFQPETNAVFTYVPLEPENQFTPQARQTINVPAGNRYNTSISIFNTNRAPSGELELVAIGLPDGVTMHAPRVTAAMPRVPVVFEAAADAKLQGRFVEIVARPVESDKTPLESGFRQVIAMNAYGNNDYYLHTVVDKLAVAVTEPAPFTIEVDEPKSAIVQNGEMPIKFSVRRADGFDGPVTVSMEWRPNGVTAATPITIRPDQTDGEYLIGAARNATASSYQVALTCVSGGDRPGYYDNANRTYVATQPFKLTVAEPHIEARFNRTSVERGKTSQVIVKLNHLKPFDGTAKATLARLPRGVVLVEPTREITSEDKEVTFTVRATEDALVGNYQGITLDLTVIEDGQSVRQLSGYGLLRIDAERGVAGAK
jgi:hypothetical protein